MANNKGPLGILSDVLNQASEMGIQAVKSVNNLQTSMSKQIESNLPSPQGGFPIPNMGQGQTPQFQAPKIQLPNIRNIIPSIGQGNDDNGGEREKKSKPFSKGKIY